MKKIMAVLTLALVICTCAFASHKITVSVNPYTFQKFVQRGEEPEVSEKSRFGFGPVLSYDWNFYKGLRTGADIKLDTYYIEEKKNFTDISILAKIGYLFDTGKTVALYANVKAGLDVQMHDTETSAVFEFGPEIGLEFKVTEHVNFVSSCECLFGFPRKGTDKYSEFRVTPALGLGYTF